MSKENEPKERTPPTVALIRCWVPIRGRDLGRIIHRDVVYADIAGANICPCARNHSIAHPGRLPPKRHPNNGATVRGRGVQICQRGFFSCPFCGFLLSARSPECIAREGNASPAKTECFVWTVPNSGLAGNRKQSRIGAAFSLVPFLCRW